MANRPKTSVTVGGNIQNLPDFVQKLSADSITPGRMSVLTDNYGSISAGAGCVSERLSVAAGSGMIIPLSILPTPVLDTISIKTEPNFSEDMIKPKIKLGKYM